MKPGTTIVPDYETVERWRRWRYNPLSRLTATTLSAALEGFERGELREAAMLWEVIADRDDVIKAVKPKREKAVSALDMQVTALKGAGTAGDRHQEVLEEFWQNVRAANAYDRNERGGRRRLIRQMMTAVSYRYAVHHIVWQPRGGTLRADFEFVPLWLFENRTGTLRFLRDPFHNEGEELAEGQWLVTHGDGLMVAGSIGYFAKRAAINDWLIFSEKFSVPGVLGVTTAAKGSAEGEMMKAAVAGIGHDYAAVLYSYDGTNTEPIRFLQPNGNPQAMPMPAVIERVDRRLAALWRGQDLSSMSSGQGSEGSGASLMADETDLLLDDDAATINDALAEVSRTVIEWHFGRGTEPLAEARLVVPADEDGRFLLDASTTLADRGAPVSLSSTMERLAIQKAESAADQLGPAGGGQRPAASGQQPAGGPAGRLAAERTAAVGNAFSTAEMGEVADELAALLAGEMIDEFETAGGGEAELAENARHDKRWAAGTEGSVGGRWAPNDELPPLPPEVIEGQIAQCHAWLKEDDVAVPPEMKEAARKKLAELTASQQPAKRATATSRQVGSIPEVINAALTPGSQVFCDWGTAEAQDVALIQQEFGLDLSGAKRVVVADEVRKILRDHGSDPLPVTYQDIEALPQMMGRRAQVMAASRRARLPRIISLIPQGDTTIIVEEIRTGRNKLALMSMQKVPGEDLVKITRTLRAIPGGSVAQTAKPDAGQSSTQP